MYNCYSSHCIWNWVQYRPELTMHTHHTAPFNPLQVLQECTAIIVGYSHKSRTCSLMNALFQKHFRGYVLPENKLQISHCGPTEWSHAYMILLLISCIFNYGRYQVWGRISLKTHQTMEIITSHAFIHARRREVALWSSRVKFIKFLKSVAWFNHRSHREIVWRSRMRAACMFGIYIVCYIWKPFKSTWYYIECMDLHATTFISSLDIHQWLRPWSCISQSQLSFLLTPFGVKGHTCALSLTVSWSEQSYKELTKYDVTLLVKDAGIKWGINLHHEVIFTPWLILLPSFFAQNERNSTCKVWHLSITGKPHPSGGVILGAILQDPSEWI